MNKADKYLKETILEILEVGQEDVKPRPKYKDGSPAYSKFITQQVFKYDISKGEFPITTLRKTPLKAAFHDIEAIYIKQTNIVENMHPSIHSWWKDFTVSQTWEGGKNGMYLANRLGATYGATVKRYKLIEKLLTGLEENPYGRRHSMNLNQEEQKLDDPQALQPCAFETLWSVRGDYIDLTLIQRSQDFCMTASINPSQYVMLGMMVCNHLKFKTGIDYRIGNFLQVVQNCHIYLRHLDAANELIERISSNIQPKINLICEPKDFYSHTVDDFEFLGLEGIEPLNSKLELAI